MRRKLIIGTIVVMAVFMLFMVWYKITFSMEIITPYEVGNKDATHQVLIATQGSEYKNLVVENICQPAGDRYYKVIDVTTISEEDPNNWDAIIVLHTWEVWQPEPNAEAFLNEHFDPNTVFVLATSGSGEEMVEGVDGISAASDLTTAKLDAKEINQWLVETLGE